MQKSNDSPCVVHSKDKTILIQKMDTSENSEISPFNNSSGYKLDSSLSKEISDNVVPETDLAKQTTAKISTGRTPKISTTTSKLTNGISRNIHPAVTHPLDNTRDTSLSLESLDLELPTLDTYVDEPVDFPPSPKELRQTLEA